MSQTFSVFVSSSDSYSDIWDVFFDMYQKFWPEYKGKIYLNTEEKNYCHRGLNIICTKVGKHKAFGETFRAGLDVVKEDNVLVIMIDYMFMGAVNHAKLNELFIYFYQNNLDSLCLKHQGLPSVVCDDNPEISRFKPSCHVFSYQIAFWKKAILKEMALPHENPWTSEWYGNKRALQAKLDIRTINEKACRVFTYNAAGCLHQGKWLPDAVSFLQSLSYSMDFTKRGFYQNGYQTLRSRYNIKKNMILHGLKGSYWYSIKLDSL